MTDKELLQEALDALTYVGDKEIYSDTIDALRARLAQPDGVVLTSMRHPEILAVDENADVNFDSLETIEIDLPEPEEVEREWVGLTDKDIEDCLEMSIQGTCRAIEAKLKEKNT